MGSSGWREEARPQLSWWHNHVLAAAGCTQSATSTLHPRHRPEPSWSPAGRGAEDRGERLERLSGGSAGRWAAAGRHPEQPRLLPASVGGTSPPGKHPAAHSAQASEDTQALLFKSDNSRQDEGRLLAREPFTWSEPQLQQAFGGCQCQQQQ